MEETERDILERNSDLLIRNMILTDDFYSLIQSYHVLPATMVADVKSCKTRTEQNTKLLDNLKLRGCNSYRKFRHVLALTGHAFLADHLHEEETATKFLRAEDLFGKFQTIFNHVSDDQKTKLLKYLESKLKERMLSAAWTNSPLERSELLESRKGNFEHEKDLRKKVDSLRCKVQELTHRSTTLEKDLKQKECELKLVQHEMTQGERRFKDELGIQSRFNAANSSSILRLKERFCTFNGRVHNINKTIQRFLGEEEVTVDNDMDNIKISVLEKNLKKLMQRAQEQLRSVNNISNERETILRLLKRSSAKIEPLSESVKRHIDKENKAKLALCKETEKLNDVLHDKHTDETADDDASTGTTDLRLIKNMIATVRVEIEHIKKKLNWKDSQIAELVEEIAMLRQGGKSGISLTKVTRSSKSRAARVQPSKQSPPSSPESTHEMSVAYGNYEEYLHQTDHTVLKNQNNELEIHPKQRRLGFDFVKRESSTNDVHAFVDGNKRLSLPGVKIKQHFSISNEMAKSPPTMTSSEWTTPVNDNSELDSMDAEELSTHLANKMTDQNVLPPIAKSSTPFIDFTSVKSNMSAINSH